MILKIFPTVFNNIFQGLLFGNLRFFGLAAFRKEAAMDNDLHKLYFRIGDNLLPAKILCRNWAVLSILYCKFFCFQVKSVVHRHYMYNQVVYGHRFTQIYICKIGIFDKTAVNQNHKAGTDRGHTVILDEKTCIFTQTDSQCSGVAHDSLKKPANPAALNEMSINNNIIDEPQPLGSFNLTLKQ